MRHINRYPRQGMRLTLMLLPFVLMIAAWFIGSAVRLEANPQDKLLPGLSQMIAAIDRMASPRINAAASICCGPTR